MMIMDFRHIIIIRLSLPLALVRRGNAAHHPTQHSAPTSTHSGELQMAPRSLLRAEVEIGSIAPQPCTRNAPYTVLYRYRQVRS